MQPVPFGKYLLLERVAQGGMAEVFRAVLRGPDGFEKTVALKRILPELSAQPEFVARFLDEARLCATLTHVNIAQVFDYGVAEGRHYLAMEFVEGVDLARLCEARAREIEGREGGPAVPSVGEPGLPLPAALFIAAEAARGLGYAHARVSSAWGSPARSGHSGRSAAAGRPLGIVHRDVSPHNLLLSRAGEVKVADFGIAKAAAGPRTAPHTASGAMLGKLRYMSPEQVEGEPLDGRSDIYSLGAVLWEIVCGQPLASGDSPARVVDQVRRAEIPPSPASLPPELERILAKALARDRTARYALASDLARDLTLLLAERAPGYAREDLALVIERLVPSRPSEPRPGDSAEPPEGGTTPELAATEPVRIATLVGAASAVAGGPASAPTVADARPPRLGALLALGALLVLGASYGVAHLGDGRRHPIRVPADAGPTVQWLGRTGDAGADAAVPPPGDDGAPRDPRREALLQALRETPREDVVRRGVASSAEYLAVISAVDAALCATPLGDEEPRFPSDVEEPLRRLAVRDEAAALARYVLYVADLPPEAAGALRSFLVGHGAFAPAGAPGPGWSVAALASLVDSGGGSAPAHAIELVRQQGALGRWVEPLPPGTIAASRPWRSELCERVGAVARLERLAPGAPLATRLRRFLAASPPGVPVVSAGLRYRVTGAEREREAGTLGLAIEVTNPGGEPAPLALHTARLCGAGAAPTVDPDPPLLPANSVRELRLRFSGVTDEQADGAVLCLEGRPGLELQGYSEPLR